MGKDNAELLPRQRDYLGFENQRNKDNAQLYTDVIRAAFGDVDVLVGHHLTFERHEHIETENEVPSADTIIFDVDVARRLFGASHLEVLRTLAVIPCERRDAYYAREFYARHPHLARQRGVA